MSLHGASSVTTTSVFISPEIGSGLIGLKAPALRVRVRVRIRIRIRVRVRELRQGLQQI